MRDVQPPLGPGGQFTDAICSRLSCTVRSSRDLLTRSSISLISAVEITSGGLRHSEFVRHHAHDYAVFLAYPGQAAAHLGFGIEVFATGLVGHQFDGSDQTAAADLTHQWMFGKPAAQFRLHMRADGADVGANFHFIV